MSKKNLYLIDAYALIFRGYYAFIKNPRINSKGLDTSAVLGFLNSLFDVIKREKPENLAVCFDKGGSAERVEMFEEYKANRDETPEAIKIAVPYIQRILNAMHIPVLVAAGYEADDIIGTIAKKLEKEDYKTFMVTPDKDFAQLVSENIFMYRPVFGGGYETWGIEEVKNKFEVSNPDQVIDYLGMMGDSADNIPGLPGVGDKTAKKFIAKYGSLESLLENTHELKGKMKEKIEANKELGLLSKKLATINLEVPIKFNNEDLKISEPNKEEVKSIFEELEFRRLYENFLKTFNSLKNESSEINTKTEEALPGSGQFSLFETGQESTKSEGFYQDINTKTGLYIFLEYLNTKERIGFTITKDLNQSVIGIGVSWSNNKAYFLNFEKLNLNRDEENRVLKLIFENEHIEKISSQLKEDIKTLNTLNINICGAVFDITLAHYLINADMRHTISILSETYLNITTETLDEKSIKKLDKSTISKTAAQHSDIILQLKDLFINELKEAKNLDLYNKIELPLLKVLSKMEIEGVKIDSEMLEKSSEGLQLEIEILQKKIFEAAEEEFNIASPKQLGVILFEKLKLSEKPKKTKSGQYATSEDILTELAKEHKFVEDILEFRSLSKLKNTYIDALPKLVDKKTGRVHTTFSQNTAATGRLSSLNPNLQNIPIRTDRGKEIRKAFIPRDENHVLMAADYSQIELRIIAALSEEENMIKAFKNNEDIHKSTAAKVYNLPIEEVTREQRSNAKTVNFGIIYGVSAFGLSNQTTLTRKESKELIETYYTTYPKLKSYIQKQIEYARENNYVETIANRRRYLKDINSRNGIVRSGAERNAVNTPIQGSAADIIKIAMINIDKQFSQNNIQSKIILQVHDELVLDVLINEKKIVKEILKNEMENAFKLSVNLNVDIEEGRNWLEAH